MPWLGISLLCLFLLFLFGGLCEVECATFVLVGFFCGLVLGCRVCDFGLDMS